MIGPDGPAPSMPRRCAPKWPGCRRQPYTCPHPPGTSLAQADADPPRFAGRATRGNVRVPHQGHDACRAANRAAGVAGGAGWRLRTDLASSQTRRGREPLGRSPHLTPADDPCGRQYPARAWRCTVCRPGASLIRAWSVSSALRRSLTLRQGMLDAVIASLGGPTHTASISSGDRGPIGSDTWVVQRCESQPTASAVCPLPPQASHPPPQARICPGPPMRSEAVTSPWWLSQASSSSNATIESLTNVPRILCHTGILESPADRLAMRARAEYRRIVWRISTRGRRGRDHRADHRISVSGRERTPTLFGYVEAVRGGWTRSAAVRPSGAFPVGCRVADPLQQTLGHDFVDEPERQCVLCLQLLLGAATQRARSTPSGSS